jgi:hypothetical protein
MPFGFPPESMFTFTGIPRLPDYFGIADNPPSDERES